jgi:hypothetical protein
VFQGSGGKELSSNFQRWYGTLSPRRRTGYAVLIAVIVATIPCYCIGAYVLIQGVPPAFQPKAQPTPTRLDPTPTANLPTSTPVPDTPVPTDTIEPTPTQLTLTLTPTALPTEIATLAPTETATATETATETPTPTETATATPTESPSPTATNTPSISGTIQPLPQLRLEPRSGPRNSEVTISGLSFAPRTQYLVYWNTPENQVGTAETDDLGQILPVIFTVPESASVGKHQVVVELDGVVVARASFEVTTE